MFVLMFCTALRDSLLHCEGMAVCCCNPPNNNSRCCRAAQVKVAQSDVRGLLETMVAADFLDLQQKSQMMLNPDEEDWRKWFGSRTHRAFRRPEGARGIATSMAANSQKP